MFDTVIVNYTVKELGIIVSTDHEKMSRDDDRVNRSRDEDCTFPLSAVRIWEVNGGVGTLHDLFDV